MKRQRSYKTVKNIFIFIFILLGTKVNAQDVHFSQQRFSPLTVNPGLSGLNGKYNAIANYRSQWNSVAAPFTTMGASFDTHFGSSMNKKGFLAMGINFFHDIAGDLKMTNSSVNFSTAYHLRIDEYNTIGLGIQAGYGSRGIGKMDGFFASQYNGVEFDANIPSGETFRSTNVGFFDLGSGLVYKHNSTSTSSFSSDGLQFSLGVSAYHLTRPNYSILKNGEDEADMRFSVFADADIILNSSEWSIMPGIYYQKQGGHQEFIFGTYLKYAILKNSTKTNIRENFSIAYGPFYRWKDALVNALLVEWSNFSLGFSYDFNISTLTSASKGRGGFEIMFRYNLHENQLSKSRIR